MLKLLAVVLLLLIGLAASMAVYVNSDSIFWGWTGGNIKGSKAVGDVLIQKIQMFQADNKHLPKQLDELVPRYLESVPSPTAGDKHWDYHLTGIGDTFYLGFGMPADSSWHRYPNCSYDSRQGIWYVDE